MHNGEMFDWNDLRFFLAVARTGSALAASRTLAVDPTTVARRIGELERAIGGRLFNRGQRGYALTETGIELRASAERVEAEAHAFAAEAAAVGRRISGVIRVTTNEGFANTLLVPAMSTFHRLHPNVRVDLIVDELRLDLARGVADVALCTGRRPTEGGLVARRLASTAWAVFCSTGYAAAHGRPGCLDELARHGVIAAEGPIAALPGWRWLRDRVPNAEVVAHCNSVTALISALRAGLGITVLPIVLGDSQPGLVRCTGPLEGVDADLWLVTRENLRGVLRIRVFMEFLAGHVAAVRPLLEGKPAAATEAAPPSGVDARPRSPASRTRSRGGGGGCVSARFAPEARPPASPRSRR